MVNRGIHNKQTKYRENRIQAAQSLRVTSTGTRLWRGLLLGSSVSCNMQCIDNARLFREQPAADRQDTLFNTQVVKSPSKQGSYRRISIPM